MKQDLEHSHQTKGLLRLTMACNERCSFCNVPVENYQLVTPSWDKIVEELEQFVHTKQQTLTISGGEPTLLRKRLLKLIRLAREKEISYVELQTNAILIDQKYAEALKEAGLTSAFVSLLSDQAEFHDELVKVENAFEKCITGIHALLEQDIWVTLNPVITKKTESRIVDYIDFVGNEFPKIKTISLSAVQPHGRAEKNWNLLPDYEVLATLVPKAIAKAEEHNIELLNPYCGLPICVGWTGDLEHCVERVDRNKKFRPNIRNQGNKSKRSPCLWCSHRILCGGVWHQYWEKREGSGISPPFTIVPPWIDIVNNSFQRVLFQGKERQCAEPTVWYVITDVRDLDFSHVQKEGFSELVLFLDWKKPQNMKAELRVIQRLQRYCNKREQRIHFLLDSSIVSQQIQEYWLILAEKWGCNIKIGTNFPIEMMQQQRNI